MSMNREESPRLFRLDETDSTNNYLRKLLAEGRVPEGSVVVTRSQTAGRGQVGNSWESEPGKNLTFSMVIYPDFILSNQQFTISQAVSLAVKELLDEYVSDVSVKWPNDIYWRDRKICGILIENDLLGSYISQSIIGIGINVNQTVFRSDAPNPVSLSQITGDVYDLDKLLDRFMCLFFKHYVKIVKGELLSLRQDYFHSLYRKDGYFPYKDENGEFNARIDAVEPSGHLILEEKSGAKRRYAFKEVSFILR